MSEDAETGLRRLLGANGYGGVVALRSPGLLLTQAARPPTGSWEQPALTARDGVAVSLVGRLDNVPDLRRELGTPTATPADLVAHAYVRHGLACFDLFLGDWIIAIWCAADGHLVLARDGIGVRHAYYCCTDRNVRWSSDLGTLAAGEQASSIDPRYLAGFLTGHLNPASTPWARVSALPPGTIAVYRAGQTVPRLARFWRPRPQREWQGRDNDEYSERLLTLLRDSVRHRLLPRRPTWIELSGGLDSSTIVAIAAQLLNGAAAHPVSTITYMFDESISSDERMYSRQIQERYGLPRRELREGEYSLFFHDPDHGRSDVPIAGGGRSAALIAGMKAAGVSSLLSGSGGDAVMWNLATPRMDLADFAIRGRVRPLISRCHEYHRREHCSYRDLLWNSVVVPLVRGDRHRLVARARCPWINWRRLDTLLDPDPPARDEHRDTDTPSQRHYWRSVTHNIGLVSSGHLGASGCLTVGYPFLDRPLIEFMLSVPSEQRRAPGATRVLHRRALTPLLPPAIVQRRHKGDAAEPLFRAIRREWGPVRAMFASESQLEQHGLVSSRGVLRALEDVRNGLHQEPFPLMRVLSLEAWLRTDRRKGGEDRGL